MTTFHERQLTTSSVTCLCWKQTSPSYLAIGTTKGSVEFYWSDCTECNFPALSYQSRTTKTRHVTSLTFHPLYDILIAIWSDGVMRSWNCEKGTISSQMSPHSVKNTSFLNVLFNTNGTRLVTTDYRGVVSIWSCTINGNLNLLYTFKLKYGCSHITLYDHDTLNGEHQQSEIESDEIISAFYMSNNEGKIYLTTDDGHCNDILELERMSHDENEKHFRLLQYIATHNKLIFITHDMTLYVYDIIDNDQSSLVQNKCFKLSIKCNDVNVICLHLFNGLLAICNEQSVIHCFDIINNENYILPLTDSRHMAAPNDTIDSLKYIPSSKVLIGITAKNRIVLWKYKHFHWSSNQLMNESSNENDWIILPPIALSQNILHVDAGLSSHFYNPNDIGIAVFVQSSSNNNNDKSSSSTDLSTDCSEIRGEMKVFCETKLHYQYSNGYTFIQFAQNRLLIYMSDDKMKKIRTPFSILILANAGNFVFLSNGEQAQLYQIERESAPLKVYEWKSMLCSSARIHLMDDDMKSLHNDMSFVAVDKNKSKIWKNAASKVTNVFSAAQFKPNKNDTSKEKKPLSANIIVSYHNNVRIYNCNGSLKTTLAFQEHEGFPIAMDLNLSLLAVVTTENILKVWDLKGDLNIDRSQRMPKTIVPQRKLDEYMNGVQSIKINADSNKISILSFAQDELTNLVDTIYIYDIEKDDCATFKLEANLTIRDHIWDEHDGRFLSVLWERVIAPGSKKKKKSRRRNEEDDSSDDSDDTLPDGSSHKVDMESTDEFTQEEMKAAETSRSKIEETRKASMLEMTDSEAELASDLDFGVISFFIAPDGIILPQEMFPTKWKYIGLDVPDFIFISKPNGTDTTKENEKSNSIPKVIKKRIRDFIGINNIDQNTKENLMNFSYYLTVGDLDEAYRSVQNIKSSSVWENMARMTVKTRRLDVAQICISNLSSSKGTSQRIASSLFFNDNNEIDQGMNEMDDQNAGDEEKSEDAKNDGDNLKLAMVAIDLKMYEDAEKLLKDCGRYDLIVKMYQALGRWMSAIEICEKYDRVHLNAAYYEYANYLQDSGKIEQAIQYYEKSNCALKITRMLYHNQRMDLLKDYVSKSSNHKILKWYAQYLESNEDYNGAMPFYERAKDYVSMVRLCCELNEIYKAETIITESKSLGAAFHLASYYEENEEIQKAINYYKESQAYHHALRLAKEHGLDEVLVDIALKIPDSVLTKRSNPKEIAARYFEENGDLSKAVMLYQKAGNINKAMDLCIEGQLFAELKNIASSLENAASLDPSVALRFSEYFMEYKQYEKAVSMLIIAKEYENALHIISNYGVSITKELAEKLTPPKSDDRRKEILLILSKILCEQQLYQLACKKYTQCGDKISAIKCLIRAGDTQKVIYYASKTKNDDANVLAANYLQSLDWHSNLKYTKAILQFYNAAKAYEQLAFFYDACAQIEIDEYRDYDKALRALKQALKQLKKSKNTQNKEEKIAMFAQRVNLVDRFSSARKFAESNPDEMVSICEGLIAETNLEAAIRVGDVFALLVEYYHSVNDLKNAYAIIQRMQQRDIILGPYLDGSMIENVYNGLGIDMSELQMNEMEANEEIIEDDIVEDIDDDDNDEDIAHF